MPDKLQQRLIEELRSLARGGHSSANMFKSLKKTLGSDSHILRLLDYFRQAFGLSLSDVKPIVALSRNDRRDIEDEELLNELLGPKIRERQAEWDVGR